jgi:hypothetical protein
MTFSRVLGVAGVAVGLSVAGMARAEEVALAAPSADAESGIANGLMVQARMQTSGGLLGVGGGPGFLLGYRASDLAFGLGFGLTRFGVSTTQGNGEELTASLTLFQIQPTVMIDVWRSRDGRARANAVLGAGIGRISASASEPDQICSIDEFGNEVCSSGTDGLGFGATLIPIQLGFGGDYFLSRNFALGAEGGLQAAFVTGVEAQEDNTTRDLNASGNMQFAYGVIRATFVLGD